jgi:phosphopantothenoylcysteine synthetase/decarboxylase
MVDRPTLAIGITGSIAAYKIPALVTLINTKANSKLVVTQNAQQFVGQRILRELDQGKIVEGGFSNNRQSASFPIELADHVDGLLIAPATANFIAKLVCGVADDELSVLALSLPPDSKPAIIAPAANPVMYKHPVVQRNLACLRDQGYMIVEPQYGRHLPCDAQGTGRLASIETIADAVFEALKLDR